MVSRLACVAFAHSLLFACAPSKQTTHPERRSPAPSGTSTTIELVCQGERLPTDLARARRPLAYAVAWSADGALVAASVDSGGPFPERVEGAEGIVVWSTTDGMVRERYRTRSATSLAFSPDGTHIAFASPDGSGILDRRTGCARVWSAKGPFLGWRSDGRTVFVAGPVGGGRSASIAEVDPVSGSVLHDRGLEATRLLSMGTSRRAVALLDGSHAVHVLTDDLARMKSVPGSKTELANVRFMGADGLAITPDGALVAAGFVESTPIKYAPNVMPGPASRESFFVRLLALPDLQERERFLAPSDALAFSPDGTELAMAANTLAVRTLSTKETHVLDAKLEGAACQIAWSPDGATIALASLAGHVRLYDARTGAVRVLRTHEP